MLYDSTRRTLQVVVDSVAFALHDALSERVLRRIREAFEEDGVDRK